MFSIISLGKTDNGLSRAIDSAAAMTLAVGCAVVLATAISALFLISNQITVTCLMIQTRRGNEVCLSTQVKVQIFGAFVYNVLFSRSPSFFSSAGCNQGEFLSTKLLTVHAEAESSGECAHSLPIPSLRARRSCLPFPVPQDRLSCFHFPVPQDGGEEWKF